MTSSLDTSDPSVGDRRRSSAYQRDFWPVMVVYLALLPASLTWGDLRGENPWRLLWVAAFLVPALGAIRAVVRHLRRSDEFQRLVLLNGMAVGFATAMVTAMAVGFLGVARLEIATEAGWLVLLAGMIGWPLGCAYQVLRR